LMDKLEFGELKQLCKYKGEKIINATKVGLCEKVYNYVISGSFDSLYPFTKRQLVFPEQSVPSLNQDNLPISDELLMHKGSLVKATISWGPLSNWTPVSKGLFSDVSYYFDYLQVFEVSPIVEILNMKGDEIITDNRIFLSDDLDQWKRCSKGITYYHFFLKVINYIPYNLLK